MNCKYKQYLGRQTHWDYQSAAKWNERIHGILFTSELAGPCGTHCHIWVPPGAKLERIKKIVDQLYAKYDVVSGSWDYIPNYYAREGTRVHEEAEKQLLGESS